MAKQEREARAEQRKSSGAASGSHQPASRGVAFSPSRLAQGASEALQAGSRVMLEHLARRDDGWLRIIPSRDNSPVYFKWKFTRGKHERTYVMAVVQPHQVDIGLQLLLEKLGKVDQGLLKPTPDKLHDSMEGAFDA